MGRRLLLIDESALQMAVGVSEALIMFCGFWRLCCMRTRNWDIIWQLLFEIDFRSVVSCCGCYPRNLVLHPPQYYFAISKFLSTSRVNSKFAYGCDLLRHRALYFQGTGKGSGGRLTEERFCLDPSNGWLKSIPISVDDQWKDEEHYGYHWHKVWFDCSMISIPFGVVGQSHVFVWHEPHIDA